jgi:lipoprotein-anchoring transpeptidase ErfK/SrfK
MNAQPAARRGLLFVLLLLGLFFLIVLALAVTVAASPTAASMLQGAGLPTATPNVPFILAEIAKPSYTPSPTNTPVEPPTPSATATATPPLLEMSIVEEASSPSGESGAAPPPYVGGKYILVDISEQHMYVYENDQLLYSFVASTGINNATRAGLFHVQSKIPNAYGATWNIWMPNWLGIYWAGGLENGIHSLPILPNGAELWAGYLGRPISYGCVVLDSYDSSLLYNWAEIGTPVEIRW